MIRGQRILFVISIALAALAGLLFLLNSPPRPVQANAVTTRCVTPTGSGCNLGVCGNLCYGSIQEAVDAADTGDDILVATGTYTGVHGRTGVTQVVYLTKTVAIRGGYSGDLAAWDPESYPTTLDAQRQGRVVYVKGNITPTLEWLIITGGNGTGQIADCPAESLQDGCGGGILVYDAQPIIVNNVITDNVAAVTSAGMPTGYIGYGGGIYMTYADGAVISGNLVFGNAASQAAGGRGGGLALRNTDALVHSNQILDNYATTQGTSTAVGGGIVLLGSEATIQDNLVQGNWANGIGTGQGGGLHLWYDYGPHVISHNRFTGNHGGQTVVLGYSQSSFAANQVVDNSTSVGVRLFGSDSDIGPMLSNNVIARSGDTSLSAIASVNFPITATLLHNTLVGSGTGSGIYIESAYVTLLLTNTIVASHTLGITNTFPASSTVAADHTLFFGNLQNGIEGTNPEYGDPAFLDPGGGDYHVGRDSAAIDVGVTTAVDDDVDGDRRPIGPGPDIGADEARLQAFLPLVLRSF